MPSMFNDLVYRGPNRTPEDAMRASIPLPIGPDSPFPDLTLLSTPSPNTMAPVGGPSALMHAANSLSSPALPLERIKEPSNGF